MAGHVRKRRRKDGTTVYQARYPDPNAIKPNQEILKTFPRKRDAEDWLAEQHATVVRGQYIDPRRADRPFTDVVEAWKETRWPALAPKTRHRYQDVLNTHLLPTFGARRVGTITREVVRRYLARLGQEGLSPGSVRKVHTVLSSIFTEAVEQGIVRDNPCARPGLPAERKREQLYLTAPEVTALANAINPRYRALIYTAAYTGLRSGELTALRRKDLDPLRGRLQVERAVKDWQDGQPVYGTTKTGRARAISLPRFLRDMLNDHLTTYTEGGSGPDALVFTGPDGQPLYRIPWTRNHFKPAVAKALPPEKHALRFHDLRHTCASLLIAHGVHPKAIQERLGHASITTTLDRYGHLLPSLADAAADALDTAYLESTDEPRPAAGTVV